jgi:threonine synthase
MIAERRALLSRDPRWSPIASLECLSCGLETAIGPEWAGCSSCGGPLVVAYADIALPSGARDLTEKVTYLASALLPIDGEAVLDLGQGPTPLLAASALGARTWLKNEGQNPTGSHKDRFHALSEAVAVELGYRSVVASSTGNHGASCAAFAALAGLQALICLDPGAPAAIRSQLRSYGATIAVVPGAVAEVITRLVDSGWYPSTSADASLVGRGNPFGCEGYKRIAYEIAQRLGHSPEIVALPVASGDTYFGIWKGFRELHERLGQRMPLMLACQPAGAAPLAVTERQAAAEPLEIAQPESLALSAREARSGWHATHALRLDGRIVEVPEADLLEEIGRLGRAGLCVEPASALASAGLGLARRDAIVDPDAETVCVITSSGLNWTEHLDLAFGRPDVAESVEELIETLSLGDEVAAH